MWAQLERLCGLMKWIDEECGVVPLNSLVLTPNDVLIKNSAFTGQYTRLWIPVFLYVQ